VTTLLPALGLAALAVGAGVSVVVQQALNAELRAGIGSPLWAALVSYVVGALAIAAVLLALREPWPDATAVQSSAPASWAGGLFGTVYIVMSILLMPRLGAATTVALLVAGQMLGSIAFDHFGLFGLTPHRADWPQLAGALLLIAGVVLIGH
jgi:bacterial/archaeal transporter family-2 protein